MWKIKGDEHRQWWLTPVSHTTGGAEAGGSPVGGQLEFRSKILRGKKELTGNNRREGDQGVRSFVDKIIEQ